MKKIILNTVLAVVAVPAASITALMAFAGMPVLGGLLTFCVIGIAVACWSLINTTEAERAQMRADRARARDAGGIHWLWWVFWLIVFFPALIVVAIVHSARKNRAAMREIQTA